MTISKNRRECEEVLERIDSYLDGNLTDDETILFDKHVGQCAGCRQELLFANKVHSALHTMPNQDCPDAVVQRAIEQIEALETNDGRDASRVETRVPRRRIFGWGFGFIRPAHIGALAIILVISALIMTRTQRSTVPVTLEEIEQAETELKWTLAYLSDVSVQVGHSVRDEALGAHLVAPTERAVRNVLENTQTPTQDNKGEQNDI